MKNYLGMNPDELNLRERAELAGQWAALELYHPANLALRRIAALGPSPEACEADLRKEGKEPVEFQYVLLRNAV